MASVALGMGVLAVLGAMIFDAKLVDPDGFIGPSYLRLPTVVALGFAIDLIPRTLWVSRFNPRRMPTVFMERVRTHWTRDRMILVVSGILCFYVTYVSYRNLKSQLPFIEGVHHKFDRELFMGLMRVRGMEAVAPERFAEGFTCRKAVLDSRGAPV